MATVVHTTTYGPAQRKFYQKTKEQNLLKQKAYYQANKQRFQANRKARYARQKAARIAAAATETTPTPEE